jgi:hypothetical protein
MPKSAIAETDARMSFFMTFLLREAHPFTGRFSREMSRMQKRFVTSAIRI